jgi:hypothetical protein
MSWRVIDEGYWKEPLDFTIPMTFEGQFFKYFHQHIRSQNSTTSKGSFHRYADLPAELQLQVLQLCDAPTLFKLMHTSRDLRTESKKLFFADQNTWYRLQAHPLLHRASPGESTYDVCFLANIEQLDLECDLTFQHLLGDECWDTAVTGIESTQLCGDHINAKINNLWRTVQRICPQIKRVMLSAELTSGHAKQPVTYGYRKLAQLCPQDIDVFLWVAETEDEAAGRRRRRVLWQLRAGQAHMDITAAPKREQRRTSPGAIVVPPEKPYRGRVGAFNRANSLWRKYNNQRHAAKMHRAAAVEKHYFQGQCKPFGCPVPDCNAWFEQPEQYTTHLLATGHGPNEAAPGDIEALFVENIKRIEELRQEQQAAHHYFWDWWDKLGTKQRNIAEKEVMDQLEQDTLYAQDKPVTEHGLLLLIHDSEYNQE